MTALNGFFPQDYIPTFSDNGAKIVNYKDKTPITLSFYDSGNAEEYDKMRPSLYPGTDVIVICFSLFNKHSFENVENYFFPEIKKYIPDVPFVIIGTKLDIKNDPKELNYLKDRNETLIPPALANNLCKKLKGYKYCEISSKSGEGMKEAFDMIIEAGLSKQNQQKDSKTCIIS
eukprot:EC823981.1.p1 GENE.EC823981.1~~EC823981.1.p1  ORF type:complete len:174 (+),score=62.37 EC823981.1:136-657(+)